MIRAQEPLVRIDAELCTGCRRCSEVCPVDAIEGKLGEAQHINGDKCVMCGQCIQICSGYDSPFEEYQTNRTERLVKRNMPVFLQEPLFAAHYVGDYSAVKQALRQGKQFSMVQCAPAVRVALAEEFGMPLGTLAPGKMAAALRRLGFKRVYDTNFAADLTIMEEASELIKRVTEGKVLPMFTSCCPGWVNFVEQSYPELIEHLSSCKSPQQMAGAMFKTYGAKVDGISGEHIYSVAIMPCTCKKFEAGRTEMKSSGYQDVDAVLTTRELAYMIKEQGIEFEELAEEEFDKPLGIYSGAGTIFGVTGGVMEAAIRTAYEMLIGEPLSDVNVHSVRGTEHMREITFIIGDLTLKTIVVSGLQQVVPILEELKQGKADFHFMEVMTCPAGCISGGGQPKMLLPMDCNTAYEQRTTSTYEHDGQQVYRKSHENPQIQEIYEKFLGEPLGHRSHTLLHTHYQGKKA